MTLKKKAKRKAKKTTATAPGQALGYSLQYTRLTAMLLETEENRARCSLEVLDDVAEQSPTGKTKLIQSKSTLTNNPVGDHAVSLWKTLFNWLNLVDSNQITPADTVFEMYVSRPLHGTLIDSFHKCSSFSEGKEVLAAARELLWGKAPKFKLKAQLPSNLKPYVNAFLEAADNLVIPIIINLRLNCGSGSPQKDIEDAIRQGPVSEAKVSDIADKLCGWVKRQVDLQLEQGLPAFISRADFHHEYTSYVRRVDRDLILTGFSGSRPTETDKVERLPDIFVRQLDLIEETYDDKLEAISDFLRAAYDRTMWSKSGDVHEESFTELDDRLDRAWRNLKRSIEVGDAHKPPIQPGQLLYAQCMNYSTSLQGMETPPYFIPGCIHRLADDLRIGWHPDYLKLLK